MIVLNQNKFFPYLWAITLNRYKINIDININTINVGSNLFTDNPIEVPAAGICSVSEILIKSKHKVRDIPEKIWKSLSFIVIKSSWLNTEKIKYKKIKDRIAIKLPPIRLLKLFCLFFGCKNTKATLEPIAAFITLLEKDSPIKIINVIANPAIIDWIKWYLVIENFNFKMDNFSI